MIIAIIRRYREIAKLCLTTSIIWLGFFTAAAAQDTAAQNDLYQQYSEKFLYGRSIEFSLEMFLRESHLAWLYQSINAEIASRRKETPSGILSILNDPAVAGLTPSVDAPPAGLTDAPLREVYLAWERHQAGEFNRKYLRVRLIKSRLIDEATDAARLRMFKNDLHSAFLDYRDGVFDEAAMKFDEILHHYPYQNVADLVFYRGECFFGLQLYDQAQSDFENVLAADDGADFRLQALKRLVALNGRLGRTSEVARYWLLYDDEYSEIQSKQRRRLESDYWNTLDLTVKYLIRGGNWHPARELLDKVPYTSDRYPSASMQSAVASMNLLELDKAEAGFRRIFNWDLKGKHKKSETMQQEALVKLGLVYYLRGDYDLAFVTFSLVEKGTEARERADMGAIWSLYRLKQYDNAIKLCHRFIDDHPGSQYLYEALCLIGFSEEMLSKQSDAVSTYLNLMSALDEREEFQLFGAESQHLVSDIGEIQELERRIFLEGRRDLFDDYLALRRDIDALERQLNLAKGLKSSPFVRDAVKELGELAALYGRQDTLEQELYELQDAKLYDRFKGISEQLVKLGTSVDAALRGRFSDMSVIQFEQTQDAQNAYISSLEDQLSTEWDAAEEALALTRAALKGKSTARHQDGQLELVNVELDLLNIQSKLLASREVLGRVPVGEVRSNLDKWSDFAYERYAYGGLDFDELYAKEDRLAAVDSHMRRIGALIARRSAAATDTAEAIIDLAQIPESDADIYIAPPIPFWTPEGIQERWNAPGAAIWQQLPAAEKSGDIKNAEPPPASEPEAIPPASPDTMPQQQESVERGQPAGGETPPERQATPDESQTGETTPATPDVEPAAPGDSQQSEVEPEAPPAEQPAPAEAPGEQTTPESQPDEQPALQEPPAEETPPEQTPPEP